MVFGILCVNGPEDKEEIEMVCRMWNAYWRFWNRFDTPDASTWGLAFVGSLVIIVGSIFVPATVELLMGSWWLGLVFGSVSGIFGVVAFISLLTVPVSAPHRRVPSQRIDR